MQEILDEQYINDSLPEQIAYFESLMQQKKWDWARKMLFTIRDVYKKKYADVVKTQGKNLSYREYHAWTCPEIEQWDQRYEASFESKYHEYHNKEDWETLAELCDSAYTTFLLLSSENPLSDSDTHNEKVEGGEGTSLTLDWKERTFHAELQVFHKLYDKNNLSPALAYAMGRREHEIAENNEVFQRHLGKLPKLPEIRYITSHTVSSAKALEWEDRMDDCMFLRFNNLIFEKKYTEAIELAKRQCTHFQIRLKHFQLGYSTIEMFNEYLPNVAGKLFNVPTNSFESYIDSWEQRLSLAQNEGYKKLLESGDLRGIRDLCFEIRGDAIHNLSKLLDPNEKEAKIQALLQAWDHPDLPSSIAFPKELIEWAKRYQQVPAHLK